MICAHFVRSVPSRDRDALRPHRRMGAVAADARPTARACSVLLEHRVLMLVVMLATIALTVDLYIKTPKGYLPAGRHRPDLRLDARLARHLLSRRWSSMQLQGARHRPGRSGGRGRRLLGRRLGLERVGQPGPHVHQPQAARRARRPPDAARDRPPAPEVRSASPASKCACSRRRTCASAARQGRSQYQFTLWSSDLDELLKWVPKRGRAREAGAGHRRRVDRPRAGRLAAQRLDRPAGGRAARRAHAGHRRALNNAYRAAAGVDHLHPAQPVSRRCSRSIRAISATRTTCRTSTCRGTRRRAGAARPTWRGSSAASRRWWSIIRASFPPSPSPSGCSEGVALEAATADRAAGGARHAHARHHPGRVRRRRQGLRGSPPARSRC